MPDRPDCPVNAPQRGERGEAVLAGKVRSLELLQRRGRPLLGVRLGQQPAVLAHLFAAVRGVGVRRPLRAVRVRLLLLLRRRRRRLRVLLCHELNQLAAGQGRRHGLAAHRALGAGGRPHQEVGDAVFAWSSGTARTGTVLDRKTVEIQQKDSALLLTEDVAALGHDRPAFGRLVQADRARRDRLGVALHQLLHGLEPCVRSPGQLYWQVGAGHARGKKTRGGGGSWLVATGRFQ
eukprot:SAG22_NODE_662_length_8055_cov_5.450980_7_plen_235_part_00